MDIIPVPAFRDNYIWLVHDGRHALVVDPGDAALFGIGAQIAGIAARIEMEGVVKGRQHVATIGTGDGETPFTGELPGHRQIVELTRILARQLLLEPQLVDIADVHRSPVRAEGVEVARAQRAPVDEFDPELEAALGLPHEFPLVDAEHRVEGSDRRYGCLTHADCADILGFDQRDGATARQCVGKRRSRHPPGRTAPYNQYRPDRPVRSSLSHAVTLQRFGARKRGRSCERSPPMARRGCGEKVQPPPYSHQNDKRAVADTARPGTGVPLISAGVAPPLTMVAPLPRRS